MLLLKNCGDLTDEIFNVKDKPNSQRKGSFSSISIHFSVFYEHPTWFKSIIEASTASIAFQCFETQRLGESWKTSCELKNTSKLFFGLKWHYRHCFSQRVILLTLQNMCIGSASPQKLLSSSTITVLWLKQQLENHKLLAFHGFCKYYQWIALVSALNASSLIKREGRKTVSRNSALSMQLYDMRINICYRGFFI